MTEDHLTKEERKRFCEALGKKLDICCPNCGKDTFYDIPRGFACWNCGHSETLHKIG